jgi:hypothetical protein
MFDRLLSKLYLFRCALEPVSRGFQGGPVCDVHQLMLHVRDGLDVVADNASPLPVVTMPTMPGASIGWHEHLI